MSELEKLRAEHEALGKRIAKLEGSKPDAPKRPHADEPRGVRVTTSVPQSTLIMPSDEQLHKLLDIVLASYPRLAPAIELSFMQRLTLRNASKELADQIKPDVKGIEAGFFKNFRACFVSIGGMKLMEEPDRRHYVSHHVEVARAWLRSFNINVEISTEAFIAAALAHGVPYTDGNVDGNVWELGLSAYVGRSVVDGWKQILDSGRLRPAFGPTLRLAPRSPSRVMGRPIY